MAGPYCNIRLLLRDSNRCARGFRNIATEFKYSRAIILGIFESKRRGGENANEIMMSRS